MENNGTGATTDGLSGGLSVPGISANGSGAGT